MILPGQEPAAFLRQARDELRQLHMAGAGGRELARRRADLVDLALISLFRQAEHQVSAVSPYRERGLAVVAVGGYGRRELCPFSDIDLMLLYRTEDTSRVQETAEVLFYPLWDAGLELGHGARTVDECLAVAEENLELETSFCQARLLVGDQDLFRELIVRLRTRLLSDGGAGFVQRLLRARETRHAVCGPAGALLEPDLKDGRGGLRDIHEAFWLAFALRSVTGFDGLMSTGWLPPSALAELEAAADRLLRTRTSLHYAVGRKVDRLYLDYQEDVAALLASASPVASPPGGATVPAVMRAVAEAAQSVSILSEDVWTAALAEGGLAGRGVSPTESMPESPEERRRFLVALITEGSVALPRLERLSHRGVLSEWIPGWEDIRSLGQRDSLHTYTVDGHSLRCATAAADLAHGDLEPRVVGEGEGTDSAIDPLAVSLARELATSDDWPCFILACLLHDLAKGVAPEDHTRSGARLARRAVAALGESEEDQRTTAFLVREHLLLAETAARRDLDDPALVARLAEVISSRDRLVMLYVLTVVDSMSTGPAVWTPWSGALVRELFFKVLDALGDAEAVPAPDEASLPAADPRPVLFMRIPMGLSSRGLTLEVQPGRLAGVDEMSVVSASHPGLLARLSGVLAYHGVNILSAQVQPVEEGLVARVFLVADQFGGTIPEERWEAVRDDIHRALEGRISLDYRLAEKAARYARPGSAERTEPPRVVVENGVSDTLTVIEVHAADRIGLLYTLARTMDDLHLEVRLAKVSTQRGRVVDVFYVADSRGEKLTESDHLLEVEKALLFALGA